MVCESPIRRKNANQKTCFAKKCKSEIRRFPHVYSWGGHTPSRNVGAIKETPVKQASKLASEATYTPVPTLIGPKDMPLSGRDALDLIREAR